MWDAIMEPNDLYDHKAWRTYWSAKTFEARADLARVTQERDELAKKVGELDALETHFAIQAEALATAQAEVERLRGLYKCPNCQGERYAMYMRMTESGGEAMADKCETCDGSGLMSTPTPREDAE